MATIAIAPLADAIQSLSDRTIIGSKLRSAEWSQLAVGLRNAAQFSSRVENYRVLDRIQSGVSDILQHARNENGALTDRSGLVRDLMVLTRSEGLSPADPGERGGVADITSLARAELIVTHQVNQAYGFASWKSGQDEDALDAFPAQELVRIREAKVPRNWPERWVRAGGRIFDGRMIALKTDPVWVAISRFGNPWPPYDFGSGMWVEDVDREEAQRYGLIQPHQTVAPNADRFRLETAKSTQGLRNEQMRELKEAFGPQIRVEGNSVKWEQRTMTDFLRGDSDAPLSFAVPPKPLASAISEAVGRDVSQWEFSVDRSGIEHARKSHGDKKTEEPRGQLPIVDRDFLELPGFVFQELQVREEGPNRFALVGNHSEGGEAFALFELRPGKHGLKQRLALVTLRKFMNRAPRAIPQGARRANVRNVPGADNISLRELPVKTRREVEG